MKQQRNSEMSFAIQVIAFLFLTGRVSSWEMQNLPIDLLPQVDPDFAPVHWHSHSDKSVSNMENKVFQSKAEQESIPSFAAKFVCPFHYGDFPDPEDCSSYYKCLNKNPKKKKCPKNQNFDKISKKCVSKSNAVCADKDYNKEHENIDFKCPYNYGRYPNKKDCSKFYLCLHNKPALMYCPPDELYDIKRKKCFNKSKVKCEGRFNPYGIQSVCPSPNGRFVKQGSQCQRYYECINGEGREKSCPHGELFNEVSGTCDWEELIDCRDEKGHDNFCPSPNGRFVKQDSQCQRYYECIDGEGREKSCPDGELFEEISGTCDWKELINCRDGKGHRTLCPRPNGRFVKQDSQCQRYYECVNGVATEKSCPYNELFNEVSGTCDWKELIDCRDTKDPSCPSEEGTFLVKDSDCQSYMKCRKGKPTFFKCPQDLLFNEKHGECDWPEVVECIGATTITANFTIEPVTSSPSTQITPSTKSTLTILITSTIPPSETTSSSSVTVTSTEVPSVSSSDSSGITSDTSSSSEATSTSSPTKTTSETFQTKTTADTSSSSSDLLQHTKSTLFPVTNSIQTTESSSPYTSSQTTETTVTPYSTVFVSSSTISPSLSTSTPSTVTDIPTSTTSTSIPITSPLEITITTSTSTSRSTSSQTMSSTSTTTVTTPEPTTPDPCETFGNPDCMPDKDVCPEQYGLFPHSSNKRLFIHCDHWRPYIKHCPSDLEFDPEEKVCTWPDAL